MHVCLHAIVKTGANLGGHLVKVLECGNERF